jgi:hypothetical protein
MIPRMRFSIKSKFLAAARVKQKRREKCDHNSDVNGIKHNLFKQAAAIASERDNPTIIIWVNLMAADFADQRIALPIACEISCRAWP